MPNWKKVIVSGSDAALSSLNVTNAVTASAILADGTTDVIRIIGSGSTANTTLFSIDGNNGRLFEVSDDLSDSLFSVNTIAGLPIVEVFSDNRVIMGAFNQSDFVISGSKVGIGTSTPSEKLTIQGNISASGNLYLDGSITGSTLQVAGINYPTSDGTSEQVLTTDGSGNLSFADLPSEDVTTTVKNLSGTTLAKGTPVHAVSGSSSGNVTPVIAASASDATTMPATFILGEELADQAEGTGIAVGSITGVDTSAFTVGDIVYVGEEGGYTNVKPTGAGNLIQNLGVVTKVHASNGAGFIYGSGRSNDVPNLPVGKIWVGSENYSVTSSVVHLDETNGRLGISTTSPSYKLHVNGTSRIEGRITLSGNVNNYIDVTNGILNIKTNDDFRIFKGLNTGVYYKGGTDRFGIGTSTPSEKLTVEGNISASGDLYVRGRDFYLGLEGDEVRLFGDNFTNTAPYNHFGNGPQLVIKDGNTVVDENLIVISQSRFIGDVNMSGDLTVDGIVTAQEFHTEFVSASIIYQSGSTKFGDDTGDNHNFTGSVIISGSTDLTLVGKTGNATFNVTDAGDLTIDADDDIRLNAGGGDVVLRAAGTEYGRISSFSNALRLRSSVANEDILLMPNGTGKVGIGTSSPSHQLHVFGNSLMLERSGSNDAYIYSKTTDAGAYFRAESGVPDYYGFELYSGATPEWFMGSYGTSYFSITSGSKSSGTRALVIDANANVGIGTTTPATKLDVSGSIRMSAPGPVLTANSTNQQSGLRLNVTNLTSGADLIRFQNNGTTLLKVKENGNVGIGNNLTATEKLHISGGNVLIETDSGAELNLKNTSSGVQWQVVSGYNAGFEIGDVTNGLTDSSAPFFISSGAQVGIGTTTPATKLDVSGSVRIKTENPILQLSDDNTTIRYAATQFATAGGNWFISSGDSSTSAGVANSDLWITRDKTGTDNRFRFHRDNYAFSVYSGSSVPVRLNANGDSWYTGGDVGIGTASPDYKLHVVGDLGVSEYIKHSGDDNTNVRLLADRIQLNAGGNIVLDYDESSTSTLDIDPEGRADVDISNGTVFVGGSQGSYNGKVGIGTTAPSQKLEVRDGNILVSGSNSKVALGTATGTPRMYSNANEDLLFATANQSGSLLYLQDANGRIGIGTSGPQQKLHVNGAVSASTYYGDASNLTGVTTSDGLEDILENGNSAGPYNLDMNTNDIQGVGEIQADIFNGLSASLAYVTASAGLFIDTPVTLRDGSTSDLALNFSSSADSGFYIQDYSAGGKQVSIRVDNVSIGSFNSAGISSNSNVYTGTTGQFRNYAGVWKATTGTAGGDAQFILNGKTIMHLDETDERVGIGTTTPDEELEVKVGDAFVEISLESERDGTGENIGRIGFHGRNSGGTKIKYAGVKAEIDDAAESAEKGKLIFETKNGGSYGSHVAIDANGSMGIGTLDPSKPLHVNGGGVNFVATFESTDAKGGINLADNATSIDGVSVYAIGDDFGIRTGGTDNRLYITGSTGYVGIGTTTPNRSLDVRGNAFIGGTPATSYGGTLEVYQNGSSAVLVIHEDAGTSTAGIHIRRGGNDTWLQNQGNGFEIRTEGTSAGTAPLTIDGSGDVTLGYDLVVEGSVTAQEFHTEFVSASIIYQSGSTKFGDTSDDLHQFTGSVQITNAGTQTQLFRASRASTYAFELGNYAEVNHFVNGTVTAHTVRNTNSGVSTPVMKIGHSGTGAHISTYSTNEDLIIDPNGTGGVQITGSLGVYGDITIDSGSQATKLDTKRIAVSSTSTTLIEIPVATYVGAVIDYTVYADDKPTGMRTGQIMAAFDESSEIVITDNSTVDIGDTSSVTFTATNNGTNARITLNTPDTAWSIRTFTRLL